MASLAFGLWGIWKTTNPTKLVKIRFQHSTFKYDVSKCVYLIMMMMNDDGDDDYPNPNARAGIGYSCS